MFYPERKEALDEAIEEAKASFKAKELVKENYVTTQNEKDGKYTSSQLLAKFFKRPSENAKEMGQADLLFRDIVRKAERKMLQVQRVKVAETQGTVAKAEILAEMLFHRPGSMLTSQEIARAWEEAGSIITTNTQSISCRFPTLFLYRTIDGTCNNLRNPRLGSAGSALRRLVPAAYEDGKNSPRGTLQAQDNKYSLNPFLPPFPSPRIISRKVVFDMIKGELPLTHVLMQWGQFLDHDVDLTPELEEECEGCTFTEVCHPIRVINVDDSFGIGTPNNGNCLPFRRSLSVYQEETPLYNPPREQVNDLTSFIDGSTIYGSRPAQALKLRQLTGGLLRVGRNIPYHGNPSLPIDDDDVVSCPNVMDCFLCGDIRCNEQVSLTVMHTLWLREHNRCAGKLAGINPFWNDERLYQTCRKIVGALIQKITYEDFLPKLLGSSNLNRFIGNYNGYNSDVDPTIPNSFSTAAFRFGHSLIQNEFKRLGSGYSYLSIGSLGLRDAFFRPQAYEESLGTDPITRGLLSVNSRSIDEFLNIVLTTQLFETDLAPGMDLAALNIQRGRDHGLPTYTVFRNFCLEKFGITPEPDFQNDITHARIMKLYGSVDNADLWLAGLAERRLPGGLLGATFSCIFGLTFQGLRDGDRFFYLHPRVFNTAQRNSIRSHTLSRVICDNADGIATIQHDAFLSNQKRVKCDLLNSLDFNVFKDRACYLYVGISPRSFDVIIATLSRSTEPEYMYNDKKVFSSNTLEHICVPFQCPTPAKDTDLIIYSFSREGYIGNAVIDINGLPSTSNPVRGFYRGNVSSNYLDNGSGAFMNSACGNSGGGTAVTFGYTPHVRIFSNNPVPLSGAEKNDVGSQSGGGGNVILPTELYNILGSSNPNGEIESIDSVNADLMNGADVNKKGERKKTASLFSELEEALNKLN